MKKRYTILVCGAVQGVGFRLRTLQEAIKRGIYGFVRNEPNGAVFIDAEGTAEDMNVFLAWCQEGPPSAQVERIEVAEQTTLEYEEFSIRPGKST